MNIFCVGDVVGKAGRIALTELLPALKEELSIDFIIVNVENAAGGSGITPRIANQFFRAGCDVLTLGDHVWDRAELVDYLKERQNILRPANFPEGTPGQGFCVITHSSGKKIGVVNLLGRVFMRYHVPCPFRTLENIVDMIKEETNMIIVDFHAETTSEKIALGHFIDSRVSGVFGTHTHIQTADETILSGGTAYITDVGMTGPYDSVIGQNKEKIIKRFLTCMPTRFEVAKTDPWVHGVLMRIDEQSGKATHIQRLQKAYQIKNVEKTEKE